MNGPGSVTEYAAHIPGIEFSFCVYAAAEFGETAMTSDARLDKINRHILIELQKNGRISNLDLAEKVGLSPSACLKRTKKLEEAGYIQGYVMAANLDLLCENVMVYVEVTLEKHKLSDFESFERAINSIPEFVDCLRVSGRFDYVCFVVCASVSHFNALCDDLLKQNPTIARISSNFVMDKPKWFAGYPFHKLKWKTE